MRESTATGLLGISLPFNSQSGTFSLLSIPEFIKHTVQAIPSPCSLIPLTGLICRTVHFLLYLHGIKKKKKEEEKSPFWPFYSHAFSLE